MKIDKLLVSDKAISGSSSWNWHPKYISVTDWFKEFKKLCRPMINTLKDIEQLDINDPLLDTILVDTGPGLMSSKEYRLRKQLDDYLLKRRNYERLKR